MANVHRLRSGREYITAPQINVEPSTSRRKPRAISLDRIQRSFVKVVKKRVPREVSVERNPDLFNRIVSQLVYLILVVIKPLPPRYTKWEI